ncbi:MAG: ROK family protein [Alphaproteobacteria bacterium]|nr:ROK family protein [Alphaproteobacteria bacterium]
MAEEQKAEYAPPLFGIHGGTILPDVNVASYNLEVKDGDKFLGDRASKKAIVEILDKVRKPFAKDGHDPFGDRPSDEIGKKELDRALEKGDAEVAGLVHTVIEEFAQEFATVVRRFLKEKAWRDVERIAVGGGTRGHRIGELAIGRLGAILKEEKIAVEIVPIAQDPDDAGLLGAVHLAPEWIFKGYDALVAVDIGGSNIRVGLIGYDRKDAPLFKHAEVAERSIWCHSEEKTSRENAVTSMTDMIKDAIEKAGKSKLKLAPFVGVGCPGIIEPDGFIDRGAQNLPGNWESTRFNLPQRIKEAIPLIGDYETQVILHNDAVVQGLSETYRMRDVARWGILTVGTGLGNARFDNRVPPNKRKT